MTSCSRPRPRSPWPTRPASRAILFLNWKVGYGTKWANVAQGEQDARIDKLSTYIKANYTDKFFMAMHHEPENDVVATAGSGMTAKDYAAMFRHTVQRLRANGVNNAVFVVAYMNDREVEQLVVVGGPVPGRRRRRLGRPGRVHQRPARRLPLR